MSKSLEQWISAYGESHQDPQNILIHHICVPLIFLSVIGLAYAATPWLMFASAGLASIFYLRLGLKPLLAFSGMVACSLSVTLLLNLSPSLLIVVFLSAWMGQFIGHKIEGVKPSLFDDLKFLLIGPLWLFRPWLIKQKQD